jgi:cytochrome c oxidase subunit 2
LQGRRRRAAIVTAALSAAGLAALPQTALADVLAPDSPASSGAGASRIMYIVMGLLGLLVALAVLAAIVRAVRASRGRGDEPERRTRGGAGIQRRVGWGLGVAVLVLFVVGIVFTEQARDVEASDSSADPITIQVTGAQWLWRYEYPIGEEAVDGYSGDQPYSYQELVIPVDTPITVEVSSIDVLHTWWVPALSRPLEAVPGDTNVASFIADEIGTYDGRSTRFSGPGYTTMRTEVHVVSEEDYQSFLEQRAAEIKDARDAVQSKVDDGTAPGVALR